MPSEDRSLRALQALVPARNAFHDAVVGAVEELRGYIATHRPPRDVAATAAASLGLFAAGRIDNVRFGTLFGHSGSLPAEELGRLEQALDALREFAQMGDELHRVRVQPGVDLRDSVRGALAARGRVFAVARGAELIRRGHAAAELGDDAGFAFRLWNRAERQIAPPLVLDVDGGDLQVSGLAEYLDGRMKIVLVVNAPSPVAPLARLIGSGVFVQQTRDAADLKRFSAFDGPAIAALVPEGSAEFSYDPAAGTAIEQRLVVSALGNEDGQHPIGTVSAGQQQGDAQWLRELKQLAERIGALESSVAAAAAAAKAAAAPEPVDLLAAWLLKQTDLSEI